MKNRSISFIVLLSFTLANFAPSFAQTSLRQRIAAKMPGMPAWTKSPGFQAAKKWWKRESLTTQEQAAFNSLKKRVALGAIVAALTIIIGAAVVAYKDKKTEPPIIIQDSEQTPTEYFFQLSTEEPEEERFALMYEKYGKKDNLSHNKLTEKITKIIQEMPNWYPTILFEMALLTPDEILNAIEYGKDKKLTEDEIWDAFLMYYNAQNKPWSLAGQDVTTLEKAINKKLRSKRDVPAARTAARL